MPDPTVQDLIREEAQQQGVPPELALAVGEQESGFNPIQPGKVLPSGERALGTFQILPSTAKTLGIDPNNPRQNIHGGVRYLRQLLDQHQGNLDAVLKEYGGVRTDTKYVPGVMARISKFKQPAAAPADQGPPDVGQPPPEAPGFIQSTINAFNPMRREGRRNLAGAVGGVGGAILGAPLGPPGAAIASVAGAGLAGGAVEAGEQFLGTAPPDTGEIGKAASGQATQEMLGKAGAWLPRAVGRRLIAPAVHKQAVTALEDALTKAGSVVDAAKSRLGLAASEVPSAEAGRLTEEAIQGPAKSAKDVIGRSVGETAKSGPAIPAAPLKAELDRLGVQLTPMASHEAPPVPTLASGAPRVSPEDWAAMHATDLPEGHPLPKVLDKARELLADKESISFEDAHKLKLMVGDAVNWDRTAKKQAEQVSKGFSRTLRSTMQEAGHQPYEDATAAYSAVEKLHSKGIARDLHKTIVENPERIVGLIKGNEPTKLHMLYDLLHEQATAGGGQAEGEAAWTATRAAWTREKLIKGGLEKLPDRIAKLDPDFKALMYGDPQGQMVLKNLEQIHGAYTQAVEKEASTSASLTALKGEPPPSATRVGSDIAHAAMPVHSIYKLGAIARLIRGPKAQDLIQWSATSPGWTKLLVRGLTGPEPGLALADLIRVMEADQGQSGAPPEAPEPMASHAVGSAPPEPASGR